MRKRRSPEIVAGRVNADGSIASGDGFTVNKTGTGAYTMTFGTGFRLVAATVTPAANTRLVVATPTSDRTLNVSTFSTAPAAIDEAFHFIAVGVQQ